MQLIAPLKLIVLSIILTVCLQLSGQGSCAIPTHPDYQAMYRLYGSLGGDNWVDKTNWLDCDVCSWSGVRCNGGRVEEINLESNNLDGYFFIVPGELPELRRLDLSDNSIDISFGTGANTVPFLNYVDFSNNNLQQFPVGLENLSFLRYLNLSDNRISADLSQSLTTVNQLQYLNLSNNFFDGDFPPNLGSLPALNYLNLSDNNLSGCIPSTYGNHCDIQQNVFLGGNCSLFIPEFPAWCSGVPCSDELVLEGPSEICFGQEGAISLPGGYATYSWEGPCMGRNSLEMGGNRSADEEDYIYQITCPGSYSVTVTTSKGCELVGSIFIDTFEAEDQDTSLSFCEDGSLTLEGNTYTTPGPKIIQQYTSEGCPYNLNLTLTEIPRPRRNISLSICEGRSESVYNVSYSAAGSFEQDHPNPQGCDSLLLIDVSILPNFTQEINLKVCPGSTAEHDGVGYPIGDYERAYSAINACDSTVLINVSEHEVYTTELSLGACTGTQVFHDGIYYDIGGHSRMYESINGCDSTLNITVNELFASNVTETYTICNGQTQEVNGVFYTGGTHQQSFTNTSGCLSTLNVIVNETPAYEVSEELLMCNGVPIEYDDDHTFTSGGTYIVPKVDNLGCNYTTRITVTEADTSLTVLYIPRCDFESPVYYNGVPYINSGGAEWNINAAGCDSLVRIWLVNEVSTEETIVMPPVCAPDEVVINNVSYTVSGIYEQHFTNIAGCDSTLYVDVEVNYDRRREIQVEICPGGTITINDQTYDSPGYRNQFLKTTKGCDSLLRIRIVESDVIIEENLVILCGINDHTENDITYTQSGVYDLPFVTSEGCDSIYRLTIERYENTDETIVDRLCLGDTIYYNGQAISRAGSYEQQLVNSNTCDSTLTIEMSEYAPSSSFVVRETCEDIPWRENGQNLYTAGLHTQVIPNAVNCDSVITIDLIVYENTSETLNLQLCTGQVDTINGVVYSTDQTDIQDLDNIQGCDSTLTIVVTVVDAVREDFVINLCEGESSEPLNGEIFNSATVTEQYFTAISGCDSILTVYVNVYPHTFGQIDTTICLGSTLSINGISYESGGEEIQEIRNARGCDSTIVVYIEELLPSSSDSTFYMCEGDTRYINGTPYEFGGEFTETYVNAVGCDSTYFINLIEYPDTESQELHFICPGERVRVNNTEYLIPGIYEQAFDNARGCDSTLMIEVRYSPPKDTLLYDFVCEDGTYEFKNQIFTQPGQYRFDTLTTRGCDSTIFLSLGLLTGNDTTIYRTICEGKFFQFGENRLSKQGSYFDEIIIGGCNTPTTLNLTVLQPAEGYRLRPLCEGDDVWINGRWESEPGLYYETIESKAGCDSLLTTEIIIVGDKVTRIDTTICQGESVFYDGWIYDKPGNYSYKDKTQYGCDSIIKLNISLYDTLPDRYEFEVCSGKEIIFDGSPFGVGAYEGIYFDGVCQQRYELSIVETASKARNETIIFCDSSIDFLGVSYDSTGQFLISQELDDCEFIEFLNVIKVKESATERLFICEGSSLLLGNQLIEEDGLYLFEECDIDTEIEVFFINGEVIYLVDTIFPGETISIQGHEFSEAGEYEILVGGEAACLSTIHLKLEIISCGGERTIVRELCSGETFDFFGEEIGEEGTYSFNKNLGSIGCDSLIKLDLYFSEVPEFEIQGPSVFCDGEVVTLSGPKGYTYLWSTGETSSEIEVSKSGDYGLEIIDSEGCVRNEIFTTREVEFTNSLDIVIVSPSSCEVNDGQITINGEEAEGLLYSIDDGENWQSSSVFDALGAGLYQIIVADESLTCTRESSIPVKLKNAGIPEITSIAFLDANICQELGGEIDIKVSDNRPMEYSIDAGETWHLESTFFNLDSGTYSVQVSPIGSSCINNFSEDIVIKNLGDLAAEVILVQGLSCADASDAVLLVDILSGLAPFTYKWSVNNGDDAKLSNLASGDYTVLVEDANGCALELPARVEELNLDALLFEFQDSVLCEGDTLLFEELDSSFNYTLFKDDIFLAEGGQFAIETPGSYQIIAENGTGCFVESSFLIQEPDLDALGMDFLMSSQGLLNEEIIIVNISDPMPEDFEWLFDTTWVEFDAIDSLSYKISFQDTGVFEIAYTALINGCMTSLAKEITIVQDSSDLDQSGGTTITQNSILVDWSVTPNPNNGQFTVSIDLLRKGSVRVSLYDSFGAKVHTRKLDNSRSYKEAVNIPNLNPGVYSVILNIRDTVYQKSILIIR